MAWYSVGFLTLAGLMALSFLTVMQEFHVGAVFLTFSESGIFSDFHMPALTSLEWMKLQELKFGEDFRFDELNSTWDFNGDPDSDEIEFESGPETQARISSPPPASDSPEVRMTSQEGPASPATTTESDSPKSQEEAICENTGADNRDADRMLMDGDDVDADVMDAEKLSKKPTLQESSTPKKFITLPGILNIEMQAERFVRDYYEKVNGLSLSKTESAPKDSEKTTLPKKAATLKKKTKALEKLYAEDASLMLDDTYMFVGRHSIGKFLRESATGPNSMKGSSDSSENVMKQKHHAPTPEDSDMPWLTPFTYNRNADPEDADIYNEESGTYYHEASDMYYGNHFHEYGPESADIQSAGYADIQGAGFDSHITSRITSASSADIREVLEEGIPGNHDITRRAHDYLRKLGEMWQMRHDAVMRSDMISSEDVSVTSQQGHHSLFYQPLYFDKDIFDNYFFVNAEPFEYSDDGPGLILWGLVTANRAPNRMINHFVSHQNDQNGNHIYKKSPELITYVPLLESDGRQSIRVVVIGSYNVDKSTYDSDSDSEVADSKVGQKEAPIPKKFKLPLNQKDSELFNHNMESMFESAAENAEDTIYRKTSSNGNYGYTTGYTTERKSSLKGCGKGCNAEAISMAMAGTSSGLSGSSDSGFSESKGSSGKGIVQNGFKGAKGKGKGINGITNGFKGKGKGKGGKGPHIFKGTGRGPDLMDGLRFVGGLQFREVFILKQDPRSENSGKGDWKIQAQALYYGSWYL